MPNQSSQLPTELLEMSQRLEQWRKDQPPRTRLPESMWSAAVELAQRHGLHRTSKILGLDYVRLKKRMPAAPQPTAAPTPPAFVELLRSPSNGPVECVVEWESTRGTMRVTMKGVTPDWTSLLRAWRES